MMAATATGGLTPTERVIEALHSRGRKVTQRQGQYECQCPVDAAHKNGDRRPSLGVSEGPTGNALLYCQAGCTVPAIVGELGLSMRDLFPEKPPKTSAISKYGREKARYSYYDEDGELLYEVIRFEGADGKKDFRARTPDGNWSIKGVRKVLYNLPQVQAAIRDGRPVVVCEGEKDAETAQWAFRAMGAAATCNPFGADNGTGAKFTDEMIEALRGADVIICADNDNPGRLHADTVKTRLGGIAKAVRVFIPAEGHKDLTEHYGAGLDVAELRVLGPGDEAETEPTPDDQFDAFLKSQLVVWDDFWAEDHSAISWIAEPLIPGGGRAIALYAPAKSGKSLVILDMAVSVATGGRILGQPNPHGPRHVLYVDYEMTQADIQERLTDMGYGPLSGLSHLHYALLPSLPPLDTAEGATALCRLAELVNAEWVVIDTMGRATSGDENDADTVRNFYRHTGMRLKQAGRTYLRTDHSGKDLERGQRGSSAKNDDVDLVWQLVPMEGAIQVKRTHTRVSWIPDAVTLTKQEEPLSFVVAQGAYPDGTKAIAQQMDQLGVPLDASYRKAQAMGVKGRSVTIRAALRWRQAENTYAFGMSINGEHQVPVPVDNCPQSASRGSGRTPDAGGGTQGGTHADAQACDQAKEGGTHHGTHRDAGGSARGGVSVSLDTDAPSTESRAGDDELTEKDLF
jgi:5S rRNA maturation endonuclease (ribonuclease M5)